MGVANVLEALWKKLEPMVFSLTKEVVFTTGFCIVNSYIHTCYM